MAQRGEETSPRSHSKLVSEAGQEPKAPRACYVASHRPASRLDLSESRRAGFPVGTTQPSFLWHHLLSEARGLAHVCRAQGSLPSRGNRYNNESHSFSDYSLISTGVQNRGEKPSFELWLRYLLFGLHWASYLSLCPSVSSPAKEKL